MQPDPAASIAGGAAVKALPGRGTVRNVPDPVACQICGGVTRPGLNLGHQPVGDLILDEAQLRQPETHYPMQHFHCDTCGLTQLGFVVDPDVVYKDFPFVSGTTETTRAHLRSLPRTLAERLGLGPDHFAVDIGSNDGTLLSGWLPFGVRFLGVDPSGDPVRIANEQGLTTWHAFFNAETSERILAERGRADVVTACGCFAHIADLEGVMKGVVALLADEGVFVSDNQYWLDMVQRLHYDNAFHQHLRYYSIRPLDHLFDRYGLEVFDVERSDTYGGQIRVYACRKGAHPVDGRVDALRALEAEAGLYEPSTQQAYARAVEHKKHVLRHTLLDRKRAGQKIIGIGAPAKASTVCNYCRLGPEEIDYITEINPLRVDSFLPGVHIPILHEDVMFEDERPADAGVLFAWNYADEIIPKLRSRGWTGEVILP